MINIPKGTKDVLPTESFKWQFVEGKIRELVNAYNIKEIRTPTFEHTELFLRGVGDTTDIVNKEMYTFLDKGDRSITLKPEGTAGVGRAYLEGGLSSLAMPLKMFYFTPVFRYEKPQAGRLREHHQFGIELYGSEKASMDAEAILLVKTLFDSLGVDNIELRINSIGCKTCRAKYNEALKEYYSGRIENMCPTCKGRLEKNPLRILDCKEEGCIAINETAPSILDYLCDECSEHFENLKLFLTSSKVDYIVDSRIVRGLDYYSKTVFEFVSRNIGSKGTVCGGGRYDGLIEELGGKFTPAVGFGMGLERLILLMETLGLPFGEDKKTEVYFAAVGEKESLRAFSYVTALRAFGIAAEMDHMGRSFKAQFKFANKLSAKCVVILGEEETSRGIVKIKLMDSGEEKEVFLEAFEESVFKRGAI